jgi:hypothetical protein
MAEDEIERLLREIDGANGAKATPAQPAKASAEVARTDDAKSGGRVVFASGAAVVTGVGAWLFGIFTPWTDALDMGFAAAVAAFLTALVAGPPRWFSS